MLEYVPFFRNMLIIDLEGWADTVHHVLFHEALLMLDYAVGRIDGRAYPKSFGFQSHPLVKNTCTVDNGHTSHQIFHTMIGSRPNDRRAFLPWFGAM